MKSMDFSIVDYYTSLTNLSAEIKNGSRVGYLALNLTELKTILYLRREDIYVVGFKHNSKLYKFSDASIADISSNERFNKLTTTSHYNQLRDPKSLKKERFIYEAFGLISEGSNNTYSLTDDGKQLLRGLCYVISEALRFYAIGNYCTYFFSTPHNETFMPKGSFSIKHIEDNTTKAVGIKLFYTQYLSPIDLNTYYPEPFPYHLCDKVPNHGIEVFENRWSNFSENVSNGNLRNEMKSIIEDMEGGNYNEYDFKKWVNIKKI